MFYKITHIPYRYVALLMFLWIFAIITITASHSARASDDSVFVIKDIEVDVKSGSAVQSRKTALTQAQRLAFERLIDRVLSDDQKENFIFPEDKIIGGFVNDFEITRERVSSVRYVGTYTFRFKKDLIGIYLNSLELAYSDVSSKPLLILPYLQKNTQTVLWNSDNPWMESWNQARLEDGLVPVILPLGDIQDMSDLSDKNAFRLSPEIQTAVLDRYQASGIIIALAVQNDMDGMTDTLSVMLYQIVDGTPTLIERIIVHQEDIQDTASLYDNAVKKSYKALQDDWKKRTSVSSVQSNELDAEVMFTSMGEWIETQKTLRSVQAIENIKVQSLSHNNANVRLKFTGSESRLRLALRQKDITLSEPKLRFSNPDYTNQAMGTSPLVYELYLDKYAPKAAAPADQNAGGYADTPPVNYAPATDKTHNNSQSF